MVEAKYHEDKLKLQQQHDVAVQKVRKSSDTQPSSSFVKTPRSPLNVEVSSCGQIFSLPTLTRGKGGIVSTIVTKVVCRVTL